MRALFWSAIINGIVAVPLMVVIILIVSSKAVMGKFTASRPIIILGWIATLVKASQSGDVHARLLLVGNDPGWRIIEITASQCVCSERPARWAACMSCQ